jgi:p-cumate 2,3-dioxygenase alpha subunit
MQSKSPIAAGPEDWVRDDPATGRFWVSRDAFVSKEALARERKAIFDHCWLYIGHSSELKAPNDFLTRKVGGRDLIFSRDRAGTFRAFLNACPHRGATLVREAQGNTLGYRCFYHGWAFNNNGKFASRFADRLYPDDMNADGCADMAAVPKLEQHRDFWFVNFDPDAISLHDYLGEGARDYISIVADHGGEGMEIVGGTQSYTLRANWKLLVENSIDGYHAAETHSTYFEYLADEIGGISELFPSVDNPSRAYDLGNGHAVIEGPAPWGRPVAQWIPAWGEQGKEDIAALRAELEQRLGSERAERLARGNRNLLIFPNLIINDIMAVTVRTFYPVDVDNLAVLGWALAPKGETDVMRKRRLDNFLEFLGPGGFATPDDVEALESCQRGYTGGSAGQWNDISKGMLKDVPNADDEEQMRCFWRAWHLHVSKCDSAGVSA